MTEKEKRIFLLKYQIEDTEKHIKDYSKKIDDLREELWECEGDIGCDIETLRKYKTELNELQKEVN